MLSRKFFESHHRPSTMPSLVDFADSLLEKRAGFTPREFAYRTEYHGALCAVERSVFSDHAFPPACHPELGTFASDKQTAILITRACHDVLSVGSSAFPCVVSQCSPHVKQHGSLVAGIRPTSTLLPDGSASTSRGGSPASDLGFVGVCVRKSKRWGLVIAARLH